MLFSLDYDLLLYDVTSTYFEGQAEANDLAKRGHSPRQTLRLQTGQYRLGRQPLRHADRLRTVRGQQERRDDRERHGEACGGLIRQGEPDLGDGSGHGQQKQYGVSG